VDVDRNGPRVVIVQRALRRYRSGFYELLQENLRADGIEIRVLHSTRRPARDARDDAMQVPWAQHLPASSIRIGRRRLIWQPLVDELRNADLLIVEQASRMILNYRLLFRQWRGGPPVAFWGHGRSFSAKRSHIGERIKASISRRAHWWFAYTARSARWLAELPYPAGRITVVENAIDTRTLSREIAAVPQSRLAGLREELQLGTGPVGLYLGQLREDKRLDVLFEAAERIHAAHPGFRLLIAGNGPLEAFVRTGAERATWVSYLGSRYGQDRAALLALADLVLLPGWVGLVILDSFVACAPLVTVDAGSHGPEIDYLQPEVNGVLLDGPPDATRYAAAVVDLLEDHARLRRLREGCSRSSANFSIEGMATNFAEGIRSALAADPSPGLFRRS
jgi:glycosyltransferase involved in cell wall biosynthesis